MLNHFIIFDFGINIVIRPIGLHQISISIETERIHSQNSFNYLFTATIVYIQIIIAIQHCNLILLQTEINPLHRKINLDN